MERVVHDLVQGSPEWDEFRLEHDGASEAAAALGISKKTSRSELLRMKHTGSVKEFSAWVQENVLDYGHEVEAMARPIAEEIIGEDLFPATYSYGRPSASCDGLTMAGDVAFEHKQWAAALAASVARGELPEDHQPQCQQVMHVTGAEKLLFMVSDGTRENCVWMWVAPDPAWIKRIVAGWKQFHEDLAAYVAPEVIPAAVAEPIKDLPALAVQIVGHVAASNLAEWRGVVVSRIQAINTDLQTDQDFADADSMIKFLDDGEKKIELVKAQAQSQAVEIDEVFRSLDEIRATMRAKRLELVPLVKARKESIRDEIMQEGKKALAKHIAGLNDRLRRVQMPAVAADFAGAMKGKKTVASLRDAVSTVLANAKIAANEIADKVQCNLATLDEHKEHAFLFNDVASLVMKASDDLANLIKLRISEHQAEQARKLEEERARIRKEEQERADREAAAKVEADRKEQARIDKEAADKAETERKAAEAAKPAEPPTVASPILGNARTQELRSTDAYVPPYGARGPVDIPHPAAGTAFDRAGYDLQSEIRTLTGQMKAAELTLVKHYCERVLQERQVAA